MFYQGLLTAIVLTTPMTVQATEPEPLFEIEAIHDLNGNLLRQATGWQAEIQDQIYTA